MIISLKKEDLEKWLGQEIENFKLEPKYNQNNECVGLEVYVQPKTCIDVVNVTFKASDDFEK